MIESLRTGANRLNADLTLLEGNMGELYGAAGAAVARRAAPPAPVAGARPPAAPARPPLDPVAERCRSRPDEGLVPDDAGGDVAADAPRPDPGGSAPTPQTVVPVRRRPAARAPAAATAGATSRARA